MGGGGGGGLGKGGGGGDWIAVSITKCLSQECSKSSFYKARESQLVRESERERFISHSP